MESLYCINLSVVAYEGEEGHGHVILTLTEPASLREADTIDITVAPVRGNGNARLWAKRVLGLAAAEL